MRGERLHYAAGYPEPLEEPKLTISNASNLPEINRCPVPESDLKNHSHFV
jgi:hypothetical protein